MLPNFGEIPRPNWIEINLDNLQNNICFIRNLLSEKTKMLLPVKADAYGHGSLAISKAAIEAGIDFLGVAHLFEAVALREHGIDARILILGPCLESDFALLLKHNLTPSLQDFETAKKLSDFCKINNCRIPIHIQIDTGMHRFGIHYEDFEDVKKICDLPNVEVEGLYSHFATADMPENAATDIQLVRFERMVKELEVSKMRPPICHIANSSATLLSSKTHYNMVRTGIAVYGYDPIGKIQDRFPLKPVLKLRSTVRALRNVSHGEGVSYGHYFVAKKNMRVATIAIGYGDGYMRGEPSKGEVFIRGKPAAILGRVCMDACMVDVSEIPDVRIGDMVECINGDLSKDISIEAFAKEHNTISYEITTRMARRLYRLYQYKGKLTGWNLLSFSHV